LPFAANTTDINSGVKEKTPTPKQYYDFSQQGTERSKIYELSLYTSDRTASEVSLYTSDGTASEVSEMKNLPTADQTRPHCRPLTLKVT
jgi:hypothetical protein